MNLKLWYKLKNIILKSAQEPLISLYYYLRTPFYRGDKVFCPCCNNSFRRFLSPSGLGGCPYCGSGSRHRLIHLYLKNRTNFFSDQLRVLHFAPEHCFYRIFRKLNNLSYVTADIGSARAMEIIDMTNIPYPENYFDIILSSHVLEHIPDDRKAMSELFRVLKPGGWSIHQVPVDYSRTTTFEDPKVKTDKERELIYGHHDHKRIYGKDYQSRLEETGFNVKIDSYGTNFSVDDANKFGINRNLKIYYCKKF